MERFCAAWARRLGFAPVPDPYTTVVDVLLILTRGDHVLLALREGTGYADGQWNLPSGKLEAGEHMVAALVREAREEVGLRLDQAGLHLAVTVHLLYRSSCDLIAMCGIVLADRVATAAPRGQTRPCCMRVMTAHLCCSQPVGGRLARIAGDRAPVTLAF